MNTFYWQLLKNFAILAVVLLIASLVLAFFWMLFGNAFFESGLEYAYCFKWVFAVLEGLLIALIVIELSIFIPYHIVMYNRYKKYGPSWHSLRRVLEIRENLKKRQGKRFSENDFVDKVIKKYDWGYMNKEISYQFTIL